MTSNKEVSVVQRTNTLPMTRPHRLESVISPPADIFETPDAFVVMLDMPGVTKESIAVSMERDSLTVKGVAGPYHKEKAALLFNELRAATYVRRFNIGEGIDRNSIDAQFEHGVLTIKLFKNDEGKPREIQIK
jgi:HSP20 family protein